MNSKLAKILRKRKYTQILKIYALFDVVLFLLAFFTRNIGGIFSLIPVVIILSGYFFIMEIKFSYPQWYVTVSPALYFAILILLPPLVTKGLTTTLMSEYVAKHYMVEDIIFLLCKLGLYFRTYILAHKYNLDNYKTKEEVAKDFPRLYENK